VAIKTSLVFSPTAKKIMQLFNLENVHYDTSSRHQFEELNESLFVEKLFGLIKEMMGSGFLDFDFYVFSHQGKENLPGSISVKSDRKKALVFFSDETGADPSNYADNYFAVFKAYIGTGAAAANVFPLQLGYVKEVPALRAKPINERPINVFFRGNLNFNRIGFYRSLSPLKYLLPRPRKKYGFYKSFLMKLQTDFSNYFPDSIISFNQGFKQGYSPEKYGQVLADSRIVLCPKGYTSAECFRHFEAMRAGCVIVSEKLPETDFYRGSPIIQIGDWSEGLKVTKALLSDGARMASIQKETLAWWDSKCSEKATAVYIMEKLRSLGG